MTLFLLFYKPKVQDSNVCADGDRPSPFVVHQTSSTSVRLLISGISHSLSRSQLLIVLDSCIVVELNPVSILSCHLTIGYADMSAINHVIRHAMWILIGKLYRFDFTFTVESDYKNRYRPVLQCLQSLFISYRLIENSPLAYQ